eukprot:3444896-Amphidinium_carterae.1
MQMPSVEHHMLCLRGTQMKLNPLDTVCYMALPAALFLLLPATLVVHPMGKWPGFPSMTDWEVLLEAGLSSIEDADS